MSDNSARILIEDSAVQDIKRLCKGDRGFGAKFAAFQGKFQENYKHPGLHLEKLHAGTQELASARVDQGIRAIFLPAQGRVWTLVRVGGHEVYEEVKRTLFTYSVTDGRIEYTVVPEGSSDAKSQYPTPGRTAPVDEGGPFQAWTDAQLIELGVNEGFIPSVRALKTEEDAEAFLSDTTGLSHKVLESLLLGMTYDQVYDEITEPSVGKPVKDFSEALTRSADRMASSDAVLDAILAEDWSKWRLFLHPDQKAAATKDYSGPARISGGPGTGKTVVVIHRARELSRRPGLTGRILVATFNKALAADIESKIKALGGKQTADLIDVIHVDALANSLAKEATGEVRETRDRVGETEAKRLWAESIEQAGEIADGFSPSFLQDEYDDVVLALGLRERGEYLQAPRRGRGRRLGRAERSAVWELTRRFEALLEREDKTTWGKIAATAAGHAEEQALAGEFPYAHILVDEAQDLNPQHWRMLRSMVPEGPNDLFLASDAHQRLYQKPIVLSGLGINIRGRSSRLRLNYRTSREILSRTVGFLGEEAYEDFDEDNDTLAGYRSVLSGGRVEVEAVPRSGDELDLVVSLVRDWRAANPMGDIGIAAPANELVKAARLALERAGIHVSKLNEAAREEEGRVCIETMLQMKGLEFQYVACFGLGEAHFPPWHLRPADDDDKATGTRKAQRARSLLFVTATRARDQLALVYSGDANPLLSGLRV
ncbi:UvrD-helicase domain-containing protein [Glycomyces dulcitolivorans]|uniref:UvrD-helicase domain-containing protein n=1 Tax=Glycomyces dulcitolivorans TaxID=2200759 RepID=UPI000DD4570F|nr:UvrD-helicase domain-containing protein [Glycomyces dulcitolivorans]